MQGLFSLTDFQERSSVLFVCLGNICRSPAAEGIMLRLVDLADLSDQIRVDSAGTAGYHIDKRADPRMQDAASRRGMDLLSRSRKLLASDLDDFDLIIAMDRENLSDIKRLCESPNAVIKLLSNFLDDQWPIDVPDPYYGSDDGFEVVLDMLEAACPSILEEMSNHFE